LVVKVERYKITRNIRRGTVVHSNKQQHWASRSSVSVSRVSEYDKKILRLLSVSLLPY
jgi:hypothetical protein